MEKRHRYFFLGYLLQLVLSFYFKIGEPRSPDCNDKKNSLLGTKRKCSCNVWVNFVTVSRHAIHHDNILTSYSFQPLHLNFVLYIVLEKIRRENGQKWSSERFSVLCAKFTAILAFVTLWPVARVKSSSHAEFYKTLPSITKPISEVWFKLLLTCVIHNVKE